MDKSLQPDTLIASRSSTLKAVTIPGGHENRRTAAETSAGAGYVFVSENLRENVKSASIYPELWGRTTSCRAGTGVLS